MSTPIYIDRPPRIQPELPFGEHQIPKPPEKEPGGYGRLVQIGLPLISVVGFVLVSTAGGSGRNPLLILPMALSVVASVAYGLWSFRQDRRRQAEIEQGYADRLVELNKEMQSFHGMQRRSFRYNYPDPAAAARIVRSARMELEKAERTLRSEARLWERRVSDHDFGVVRLGIGTLPSTVVYKLEAVENFEDPQVREAMKLEADSQFVSDIPVIISLRQPPEEEAKDEGEDEEEKESEENIFHPAMTHALGVAGEREMVYEFVRSLLGHYVVFHAPMDAKLYVLATERQEWTWTEALPHCGGDDQSQFHCFVGDIQDTGDDKAFDDDDGGELEQFLEGVRKTLAQRKIRLQEHDGNTEERGDPTLPLLLVVVDMMNAAQGAGAPLANIESDAAISILLEEGAQLGAAVVFLVPERSKVPSGCRSVVEIEKTAPATNSRTELVRRLHFRYAETGVNSARYVGEADFVSQHASMEDLARQLAALDVRQGFGANLAKTVPFMDLMGYSSLRELRDDTWKKWQESTRAQRANWLRVRLGLMSGNKPRSLVFSAKRDGVHGMVAGSTGSGKSELLISMITGMAVTYDPTVLNFVLVDYKGGSAFNEFKDLPHCVDVITNLGEDGVTRMFTAIRAELERRQALNSRTGTKNIVDYRQKGLHAQEPYPYLFIIIDEFAEMIADRAEYRAQLETITRVGRAQGVSLILAAQRPSGVSDQMRSNIKFRICLRVETPSESREMLRRSDAAFLPPGIPGRGYLQVGNEEIELIQSAYTGERYSEAGQPSTDPIIWPDRGGAVEAVQDQEPPELYRAIIDQLNEMAVKNGVKKQRAPWPNFLPQQLWMSQLLLARDPQAKAVTSDEYLDGIDMITLGQPRDESLALNPSVNKWFTGKCGWFDTLDWKQYAMRPVVGLIDNPYAAKQLPLVVDFPRGHVVIFGASGWGKTTFIRSIIVSLAATHSPDHFHAYILDLGGRNLGVLANLPHVGAVIIPDEEGYEERSAQVLREIEEVIERRKTLLSNARVPDIYEYNAANPDSVQPSIVVAIDNFLEFIETFGGDADDDDTVLAKLVGIARQGKAYGIHFVISINRLGELSNQLYNLFGEHFTLKLSDSTEYRTILGESVPEIRDIPGRGYTKTDRRPLAFQVATLAKPALEAKRLEDLIQKLNEHVENARRAGRHYNLPVRVDALPRAVLFKQMLAREHGLKLDASFADGLRGVITQNWARSVEPAHADWLKVAIGVGSGNRARPLELEAKKDGVHGMIAGGTGAGKSELLMTLIIGLAINYDPSILNFVLVDYKGGGAFKPFEALPHCVDMITNLNKSAVRRVFTTISAEMQRRQRLNAETGTKDIVEYRAKGLHLTHEPYPHLFVIIDEYAEMITDSPEFRDEMDSITRVGRSAGVNLLLAAQRPVGVSDQMRANIKLRICLRVEGIDTSREMLRRADAAFLPSGMPGRGYIQVGNENIELTQMAYTGETYEYAQVPEGGEKPKFYDMVVGLTNELVGDIRPKTPWPPFLPTALTFADSLDPRYVDAEYHPLITLGRAERLAVNPFTSAWIEGKGAWYGMDWNKTAMRAIPGLLDDPYQSRQLPLVVDFTRGHAVLFGASGWGKTTFMRSLIVSLASTHSPDELHAHVLDLGGRNLEVLNTLPHVGTVIMPDERGYEERVQQLWRELNAVVDARKRLFSEVGVATLYEYNSQSGKTEPAILVVIDNFTEYVESFGNASSQNDADNLLETFVSLARQGKAYGLHFAISVNRLNVLSSKLYSLFTERLSLRLADSGDYSAIVGSNIGDIEEVAGRGYTRVGRSPLAFQVALMPGAVDPLGQVSGEARSVRALGAAMHEYIDRGSHRYSEPLRIDALPSSSSYRQVISEIFGLSQESKTFLTDLKAATLRTWERNASAEHADWLQAPLGIISGNRKRTLHFEAKRDGAHGMIAGGTGSGKSELLMTMIVGLALNFSPDILNFVLVDYKGGGAFKPFERLPHCVDIVTNLNKAAVDRMFTSIAAEIRRRQALNAETRTKDIVEYRKKGLHKTREPYPHLFIIIDEYVEMIDENPEYRMALESVTRVGRAQGVNLILASQQPKGVSDQMRANIKLRLCLRVEQMDTSRELLRRPDAALLPSGMPGRGFLQVGNENLQQIQVSYTGEPQPDEREAPVLWPDRPEIEVVEAGDEVPRLFDAVVSTASELYGGVMARKPWPNFLPNSFSLETPLTDAQNNRTFTLETAVTNWLTRDTTGLWPGVNWRGGAMRPVVGLVDDPSEASQTPLRFDLSRNHLAVFGDSGLGKSTFVRTLIVSLAVTHTPDEFHVYVLDLGGRSLRSLEELPHVGAVIYSDEEAFEERLQRLLDKIERITEERQLLLSNADATSLYDFNARYPERALPAVLVVIDNFAELLENYEALVDSVLIPLVRRSLGVGVTFVATANIPNNLTSRLYNLFGERVTFKQSNTDRYMDIVGRGAIEIGDIPGRGYIRLHQRPLLFHVAQSAGIFGEDGRYLRLEAEELRLLASNMRDYLAATESWRSRPDQIQILPEQVSLEDMQLEASSRVQPGRVQAVVGKDSNLLPAVIDLKRMGPHFAVVGPPLSGKTTTLYNWLFSLADRYPPDKVMFVLVDMQRRMFEYGGEHTLGDLPHVLASVSEVDHLNTVMPLLMEECKLLSQNSGKALYIIIDNFDDFIEEIESSRTHAKDLSWLARRYGRDGLHFVISGSLDGNVSELKRRVLSANYGIGLRTEQSVATLKVQRTPAALRGKELPAGRGFIVKAGQPSMIQIAAPYPVNELPVADAAPGEDESRIAAALDGWVEKIQSKYPDQKVVWSAADGQLSPAQSGAVEISADFMRMMSLLRIGMRKEIAHLKEGNGKEELISEQFVETDVGHWTNEEVVLKLLKELWLKEQAAIGLPRDLAEMMADSMDKESLLLALESSLPVEAAVVTEVVTAAGEAPVAEAVVASGEGAT